MPPPHPPRGSGGWPRPRPPALAATAVPLPATRGPDGNIWSTDADGPLGHSIGRIPPAGAYPRFPGAGTPFSVNAPPTGITTGPDGNIWATGQATNDLIRL